MEEIKFDILDYIGKLEGAIFVSLTLNYQDEYYDAIFCYKKDVLVITVDPKLEKKWGCKVEDWPGYSKLLLSIVDKVAPYDELIKTIRNFDSERYKVIYPY